MFFDRYKATGTQVNASTFNVTLAANYENIPENVYTSIHAKDEFGNSASMRAKRVGTQLQSSGVYSSTATNSVMPLFNGEITFLSSVGATLLSRANKIAGKVSAGQSNKVGWDTENFDSVIDFQDSRVRQYVYDLPYTYDSNPDGTDRLQIAETPLAWPNANDHAGLLHNLSVSSATHFARELINQEGWGGVDILPAARISTGTADWGTGSYLLERMIAMTIDWINIDPSRHELAVVDWQIGESDALASTTQTVFEDFFIAMRTDFNTRVFAGTGQDVSNVPWLFTGMSDDWYVGDSDRQAIQDALINLPSRMSRSAFITSDGLPSDTDLVHLLNSAQRELGQFRLIEGYRACFGNEVGILAVPSSYNANIAVTMDDDVVAIAATHTKSAPTPITADIAVTLDDDTVAIAATAGTAPTSDRPLTAAIPGGFGLYANDGVVTWGAGQTGSLRTWEDAFESGLTTTQSGNSTGITDNGADGVSFRSSTNALSLGGQLLNGPVASLVMRFKATSGVALYLASNTQIYLDGASTFAGTSPSVDLAPHNVNDDAWHDLSFVKDAAGLLTVILDGTQIHSSTGAKTASTGNLSIGGNDIAFDLKGEISLLYLNDTTALSASQVVDVLSERVVV